MEVLEEYHKRMNYTTNFNESLRNGQLLLTACYYGDYNIAYSLLTNNEKLANIVYNGEEHIGNFDEVSYMYTSLSTGKPLNVAVEYSHFDIVNLLLISGSMTTDILEWTSDISMIRILLHAGAKIDDDEIIRVVSIDKLDIVKLYITYGGNIYIENEMRENILLIIACTRNYYDIVKFLIEDMGISVMENFTVLKLLFINENYLMIKYILEYGANINIKDGDGRTLPMSIINSIPDNTFKALLMEYPFDLSLTDYQGNDIYDYYRDNKGSELFQRI